jgi:hypothetical protein
MAGRGAARPDEAPIAVAAANPASTSRRVATIPALPRSAAYLVHADLGTDVLGIDLCCQH